MKCLKVFWFWIWWINTMLPLQQLLLLLLEVEDPIVIIIIAKMNLKRVYHNKI